MMIVVAIILAIALASAPLRAETFEERWSVMVRESVASSAAAKAEAVIARAGRIDRPSKKRVWYKKSGKWKWKYVMENPETVCATR